jgi:MFS transporter, DHA2 family, multidrug resistance protein
MSVVDRSDPAEPVASPHVFAGFAMMCLGMFMAVLDVQIVATSLPTIQGALKIAPDQISWVQTAYLIAEVIAIPLTGFLMRRMGIRRLFVAAVSIFTLASLLCAASTTFSELIIARVLQGFSGGTLIPAVFAAVFLLFPFRLQGLATTIAGVLAVLAPTVGPIVGGWMTETYSWHWLFLINLAPGLIASLGGHYLLAHRSPDSSELKEFDTLSLVMLATGLATLEIALKEAPHRGWLSLVVLGLLASTVAAGSVFAWRSTAARDPLVDLAMLRDRNFAIGSALSFILGIGLFGSVYLMPIFLAYVRHHDALEIGEIMLVTGAAQLASAPLAVALERRLDPRLLTAFGFALFGLGLGLSARQSIDTDFHAMLWPQILRGSAIMFCLLSPTRLALGHQAPNRVPDASGLFNLMRNLGGAIGLALIDTVIYGLAPSHGAAILARLRAGDAVTAAAIGVPQHMISAGRALLNDPSAQSLVAPLIERAAFVETTNIAWALIAVISITALAMVPFARSKKGLERRLSSEQVTTRSNGTPLKTPYHPVRPGVVQTKNRDQIASL